LLSPPSPFSTTVRTSWRTESRPVLRAESACQLCLSVRPLVVALLAKSAPIFDDPEFFCCPPPSPFSTTVRTSWRTESRPVLHAEYACHLRLSIRPLVVALLEKAGPQFRRSRLFLSPPSNHFPLQSELLGIWNLHQFCTLNPPVNSVCPYDLWWWRYWQSRAPFLMIPTFFVVPPPTTFHYSQNFLDGGV